MMNLANTLTLTRLAILPLIIILLFLPGTWAWAAWTCLALYIIGAVTDFADGWVARKFDQVTELGRFLDPIVDKIYVVTILLMLVEAGRIPPLGVIAVVIILIREFTVAGLREFLGPKEVTLHVTKLAKWKTTIQMIATGILIVSPAVPLYIDLLGLAGLCAAAIITAMTGWNYLQAAWVHLKE